MCGSVVSFTGSSVSWPISSSHVAFPVAAAFQCLLPSALFSSYHGDFLSFCGTVTLHCCKWGVWGRCNDSLSSAICLTSASGGPLRATMNQHNDAGVLGFWEHKQYVFFLLTFHNQWWILRLASTQIRGSAHYCPLLEWIVTYDSFFCFYYRRLKKILYINVLYMQKWMYIL